MGRDRLNELCDLFLKLALHCSSETSMLLAHYKRGGGQINRLREMVQQLSTFAVLAEDPG